MSDHDNAKSSFTPLELVWHPERVKKDLKKLPERFIIQVLESLENVRHGMDPGMKFEHLDACGPGVIELKKNGSPAYRCVYYTKVPGKVIVLYAGAKTATGRDKKLLETVADRLKTL